MVRILAGMALLLLAVSAGAAEPVDLVVVEKSQRKMVLLSDGKTIRTYDVSLGSNPKGHKIRQGDRRTPEGRYIIDYRNPNSRYHRSLHISYPNAGDRARASKKGYSPGGMIMIHGSPNHWRRAEILLKGIDWTHGCIAVTNAEIEEIWDLVTDGTPIEIRP